MPKSSGFLQELNELPTPGSGMRIVPTDELVALLADPAMQDAITLIERAAGAESGIKRAVRTQLRHDLPSYLAAETNAKAIRLAAQKRHV